MEITSAIVIGYWDFMLQAHDLKTKSKSDSTLMKMARPFTGMSKEDWNRFSTLIGHTVYTDIFPGLANEHYSLLGQMCAVTHECQHRIQADCFFWYPCDYMVSSGRRCGYEFDAYTTNIEICHALTGVMIPVSSIIEALEHYRLGDDELQNAGWHLSMRTEAIKEGRLITEAGKTGIEWILKTYGIVTMRSKLYGLPEIDFSRVL